MVKALYFVLITKKTQTRTEATLCAFIENILDISNNSSGGQNSRSGFGLRQAWIMRK